MADDIPAIVFFITLIAAASSFPPHVAELFRTREQSPFPTGAFLAGCRLVAQPIDLAGRHVGCLAPAPLAALARGDGAGEGLFEEAADRLRKRRLIFPAVCPRANSRFEFRRQAHRRHRNLSGGWSASLFSRHIRVIHKKQVDRKRFGSIRRAVARSEVVWLLTAKCIVPPVIDNTP